MKTTRISDTAYQLTRLGLFNCYLVRESDGFTLIDTGLPGSADNILAAADKLGWPIYRIALTHAHGDHVGSVDELARKLSSSSAPGVVAPFEVAASSRSLPLLRQPPDKTLAPGEPAGKIKGSLPGMSTRVTRQLAEGEMYGSLRVIETPGHIPGHLSFLDERDGTLFAGDALVAVGHLTVSGFAPWFFPLPNLATWDRRLALSSAHKLLTYEATAYAAGHGAIRPGGSAVLREAIAKAL